jgi:hypothetical protein
LRADLGGSGVATDQPYNDEQEGHTLDHAHPLNGLPEEKKPSCRSFWSNFVSKAKAYVAPLTLEQQAAMDAKWDPEAAARNEAKQLV